MSNLPDGNSLPRRFLASLCLIASMPVALAQNSTPLPVRNDVATTAEDEFVVLRHQYLEKGSHQRFHEISRDGVWPFFEKIGSRVVGQWKVIHPEGGGSEDYDEGYRMARYVSYDHWKDTRTSETIGGDGPDRDAFLKAVRDRNELRTGSKHVYFLVGRMAPGGPYYMPGLNEEFAPSDSDAEPDDAIPVRNDVAQDGREIITLRTWRIKKGSFPEFNEASIRGVWPYFEKIGARVIGQWRVVYPEEGEMRESPDYDEVVMLTRYASYDHWKATRSAVKMGGNGPDYDALRKAFEQRRSLTVDTDVKFLQGPMYNSPPKYLPGLSETYRRQP